ncbi:AI-2E family transporter [Nitriliruptor alkaliphilus]|uniref:AI-2E family transporter n=1 Tax=Nitriliruptor alkaliphilus TaxID=427918 RepID=UPI000698126A|nr:AI-2E family transporter [Nitriliruptor alkaliphilus]
MDQQASDDEVERRRGERRSSWRRPDGGDDARRVPSWLATGAAWAWRLLVLLLLAAAFITVVRRLALVALPVLIALVLATLCVPPARRLEARGWPRALAAGVVVGGGVAVVGGLIAALVPPFTDQVGELQPTLGAAFERIFEVVAASPLDYDRSDLEDLLSQLGAQFGAGDNGQIAEQLAAGAILVVELITGLVLALVLLFFMVKDGEQIVGWILARIPPGYRNVTRASGARAWMALSGFIRGTAFIAAVDALLIGLALMALRVPLVLPLALLVFLGAFVPVVGATVSGLVAVLVALASGGPFTALAVLGVVLAVQQVEGQLLQPVLVRRSVALHPAVVLLAIVAGALLGGIIGALLAVPLSAVASAVANELRLRHELHEGTITAGGPTPVGPEEIGHTVAPPTVLEKRRRPPT